jgi:prepilin-type N-terminal cleavage/methylation domain-containing protein
MRRHAGFTILELLVVVAILGILAATAMPLLTIYQQRAYGSEASATLKMILHGEILYFLDHETFFPPNVGDTILIPHSGAPILPGGIVIDDVKNALEVTIPQGHFLDFTITNTSLNPLSPSCQIVINHSKFLDLFKNGAKSIIGDLDNTGKITISYL